MCKILDLCPHSWPLSGFRLRYPIVCSYFLLYVLTDFVADAVWCSPQNVPGSLVSCLCSPSLASLRLCFCLPAPVTVFGGWTWGLHIIQRARRARGPLLGQAKGGTLPESSSLLGLFPPLFLFLHVLISLPWEHFLNKSPVHKPHLKFHFYQPGPTYTPRKMHHLLPTKWKKYIVPFIFQLSTGITIA